MTTSDGTPRGRRIVVTARPSASPDRLVVDERKRPCSKCGEPFDPERGESLCGSCLRSMAKAKRKPRTADAPRAQVAQPESQAEKIARQRAALLASRVERSQRSRLRADPVDDGSEGAIDLIEDVGTLPSPSEESDAVDAVAIDEM